MKSWKIRPFLLIAIAAIALIGPQAGVTSAPNIHNKVLARGLDIELGKAQKQKYQQLLSSGAMYALLQASGQLGAMSGSPAGLPAAPVISQTGTQGCAVSLGGGTNIRVNQDCSLRRQAEEVVTANPKDPLNLIAGQNDSRIGFNHCGYDWSFDGGTTWGDQLPPFFQFVLLDGHTADACSDPTATFDAQGNAYIGGLLFDITSAANAFVVAKSNAGIGGQFYHTPQALSFQTYRDVPLGLVANDNDGNIFNDKEFIVADATADSPKANNVYATWTRYNAATGAGVGGDSPIFFSQSTNGGATWSPGIEISGTNATFCTAFSGEANTHACDQDQGSHPIVGPDGTVYVAFGNGNTPLLGINQHMIVSCPASADCSKATSWTGPAKISDDIGTQPIGPDPATGCPAGRQCLPPNGYRLDDLVEGSLSVDSAGKLYFVWADFRNGHAPCRPLSKASTAKPPCDNDVFYTFSTDGGMTWGATVNLTPAAVFGKNAQWQPWSGVSADGSKLFVAYYDRHYGTCETDGCNDITMATVGGPASGSPSFTYQRLTTSSMPNLVPANNPVEAGFLGDYMWLSVDGGGHPLIVWADTRGLGGAVEEDVYFAKPTG